MLWVQDDKDLRDLLANLAAEGVPNIFDPDEPWGYQSLDRLDRSVLYPPAIDTEKLVESWVKREKNAKYKVMSRLKTDPEQELPRLAYALYQHMEKNSFDNIARKIYEIEFHEKQYLRHCLFQEAAKNGDSNSLMAQMLGGWNYLTSIIVMHWKPETRTTTTFCQPLTWMISLTLATGRPLKRSSVKTLEVPVAATCHLA